MLKIGCHLSTSKGYKAIGEEAVSIGANTFQFFSRNPRGGRAREIKEKDAKGLLEIMRKNNFAPILAHAPYVFNAASATERTRDFTSEFMAEDLQRMENFPNNYYNIHPGSHVGQGKEKGIQLIVDHLNNILFPEMTTTLLLETMAGKGSEIGGKFEDLKQIIDGVTLKEKVGVCLDTCHVYDGGYDIVNNLDGVLEEFDEVIGLKKLKAIHLNDSKNEVGSKKDRHAKIGQGNIGIEGIVNIINHPKLKDLPFYLETPNDIDGYRYEIQLLKSYYK